MDGTNIVSQPLSKRFIRCPTKTFIGKQVSDTRYFAPVFINLVVVLSDKTTLNPNELKNP